MKMKYLCQQHGGAARCLLVWAVERRKQNAFTYLFGGGFYKIVIFIDCMNEIVTGQVRQEHEEGECIRVVL